METPVTPETPAAPAAPESQNDFDAKVLDYLNKPEGGDNPPAPETPPAPAPVKSEDDKPAGKVGEVDEKTLADFKAGLIFPKHRFDEVNSSREEFSRKYDETARQIAALAEKLKGYETFGSPEELKAKLVPKPPDPLENLSDEEKQEREYLNKMLSPELKSISTLKNELESLKSKLAESEKTLSQDRQSREKESKAYWDKQFQAAENEIGKIAAEQGHNMENQRIRNSIIGSVADIIQNDKDLARRYYQERDPNVVKEVTEELLKDLSSGIQRKTTSEIFKDSKGKDSLPRAPIKGGVPPIETPPDPTKLGWSDFNSKVLEHIKQ